MSGAKSNNQKSMVWWWRRGKYLCGQRHFIPLRDKTSQSVLQPSVFRIIKL